MLLNRVLIEFVRIAFHDSKRIVWTLPEASAEAVTVHFSDELRLTIHDLKRALGTRRHALAAAITQVFIDFYDLPCDFHVFLLML
jgi:hypothetical protein